MCRAADKFDSRLYSTHTLATKQPWLKSGGLQNLASYARKGLSKPNWRRWWVARQCASASKQHGKNWTSALSILQSGSGAVAFMQRQKATSLSTSCLDYTMKCQTNFSIVAFWQLVFITISEFLIKCVVGHIAHDIRDRVELVTHCFSQYCDSKVWNFCCVWRSIS